MNIEQAHFRPLFACLLLQCIRCYKSSSPFLNTPNLILSPLTLLVYGGSLFCQEEVMWQLTESPKCFKIYKGMCLQYDTPDGYIQLEILTEQKF